tara:strand:+ start:424 stop:654 length:231 start_codon:yes stop_codon:yes gene_type:complete
MKRMFNFWLWCVYEQYESFLLMLVAVMIPVVAGLIWFVLIVFLLTSGYIIFGGVLFLVPVFMVLMRGIRSYNEANK